MNNEFCWNFKKSVNRHEANVSSKINTMELDETLPERFKNINLNCDTYVKSGGDKDFNETMSKQPMHLKLLEELMQLKRKTNDNRKQLVHLKAMITELEISKSNILKSLHIPKQIHKISIHEDINKNDSANNMQ
ncbi:hypothetical protein PUN28_010327 [Cardiocondyla obscurior]|uniref:Uncharacterized protein n=2 Tax=Cardiocondyla obscurior TaxID=286306 RepID=A0AAW2FU37_9HYME